MLCCACNMSGSELIHFVRVHTHVFNVNLTPYMNNPTAAVDHVHDAGPMSSRVEAGSHAAGFHLSSHRHITHNEKKTIEICLLDFHLVLVF
jgi:hypothetical protein